MDEPANTLRCSQCGTTFAIELNRMRANVCNPCPSCGFQCGVSQDYAIRAHRLLEWLEYRKKIASTLPQSGAMRA